MRMGRIWNVKPISGHTGGREYDQLTWSAASLTVLSMFIVVKLELFELCYWLELY